MNDTVICAHHVEGVGRVHLVDRGHDTYELVRTDEAGNVTTELGDICLIGQSEAVHAYLQALDDLHWQATPQARNAERDLLVDDFLARCRRAHPAGGRPS